MPLRVWSNFKSHLIFLFFTLFFLVSATSQVAKDFNLPGEVPHFDLTQPEARKPAVDLIYNGKIQTISELKALVMSSRSQPADFSKMTSQQKENWRNKRVSKLSPSPQNVQVNWLDKLFLVDDGLNFEEVNGLNLERSDSTKRIFKKMDDVGVTNNQLVTYSGLSSPVNDDQFDFRVSITDSEGMTQPYRVYLGEFAHNNLLRKTLLRKLGFREPGMKYIPKLKVKFKSEIKAIEAIQGSLSAKFSDNFEEGDGSKDELSNSSNANGIAANVGADPQRWLAKNYRKIELTEKMNEITGELEEVEEEVWSFSDELPSGEVVVEFQDVLVHKDLGQTHLAFGFLGHNDNGRRRIYNSLLLAYNLVNATESVNSFSPIPFFEKDQKLIIGHDTKSVMNFSPDFYDLKWMARRLASLSRKDFEHIVAEAHYPKEVELLMIEILIARRNFMQKFFFADDPDCSGPTKYEVPPYYCLGDSSSEKYSHLSDQFKVDLKISHGPKLVNGNLKVDTRGAEYWNPDKWWVGYGSRFSKHQEESPLVLSEIFSYLQSILQSSALEAIIDKNINNFLKLNSSEKIAERLNELREQNIQYLIDQGQAIREGDTDAKLETVPIGFYTTPTASARLILNRNIAIGTQQGVDNQIQLVDTFGYLVRLGVHSELEGFDNLNLFSTYEGPHTGQIGFDFTYTFLRRWTHLRPLRVVKEPGKKGLGGPIKKALKESYSEILIPKILRDMRSEIDSIAPLGPESSEEEKAEYQKVIEKNYKVLNKYLKVGESIIISNTLGPSASGSYSHRFLDISARVYMSFLLKAEDLSRVHIHRKSEKEILIFKTRGNQVAWDLTVGANYYIPVVSLRLQKKTGKAKTWFYKLRDVTATSSVLNIDGSFKTELNLNFQQNLNIVIETLFSDSYENAISFEDKNLLINREMSPYVVSHDFKQREMNFKFLFLNHSSHKTNDVIDFYAPYSHSLPRFQDGHTTSYLRHSQGYRNGTDYQTVIKDVINYVLEDKGKDFGLQLSSSGDPADTVFGKSNSLTVSLDSRISEPKVGVLADPQRVFEDPVLKLQYVWKGGVDIGLTYKQTKKLLNKVNNKVSFSGKFELFNTQDFSKLRRLQLYRVGVDIIIYREGIERLLSDSPYLFSLKVERLMPKKYNAGVSNDQKQLLMEHKSLAILQSYSRALKSYRNTNPTKSSEELVNLVRLLKQNLDFIDFISLFDDVPKDGNIKDRPLRNVFIRGSVNGFKLGDERLGGLVANSIGFPRKKSVNGENYDNTYGDLDLIKKRIGISDSELYLKWILRSYL